MKEKRSSEIWSFLWRNFSAVLLSELLLGELVLCRIPAAQRERTPEVCGGRDTRVDGKCSPHCNESCRYILRKKINLKKKTENGAWVLISVWNTKDKVNLMLFLNWDVILVMGLFAYLATPNLTKVLIKTQGYFPANVSYLLI